MPRYSEASNNRLLTCDQRLVLLFEEVISIVDCTILCGARSKYDQDEAFRTGHSKLKWPHSKHNVAEADTDRDLPTLSMAIDVAPSPVQWKNSKRFYHFAGVVRGMAFQLEIPIRWGGDWDGDWDLDDQTFMDLVHFELGNYA